MTAGDWVTVACLAAIAAAVVFAKRRGKAALTAALSDARAEGRAEAAAEARAAAVAAGNVVHVHGDGSGAGEFVPDLDDPRTADLLRAVLQRLDTVRTRDGRLDAHRVGGVLDGVQPRPVAVVRHGEPVPAPVGRNSDVPGPGASTVSAVPASWGSE